MLGPQNNKLPLNGAPSNCLKLQTDFEMKIKTEYTEEEEEEEEELVEEICDYAILSNVKSENNTFTNLENNVPNDAYNDNKDSISRCNMSIKEESSLSNEILSNGQFKNKAFTNLENSLPNYTKNDTKDFIPRCKISKKKLSRSSNKNHVYKVKNKNCGIDHFIKSEIVDTYENDKSRLEAEMRLENAFRDCIIEMSNDLSIEDEDIFNNMLEQLSANGSATETNHKRKILLSDETDTNSCSYVIQKEHSYFDTTIKPKTIKKIKDNRTYFYDESPELEIFRKTLKSFLQKSICLSLPPKIDKCIECRVFQLKNDVNKRDYDSITCRFYAFRQLRFTKSGKLAVAGYPDPFKNIDKFEMGMWLPGRHVSAPSLFNIEASTKILEDAGGQFCKFVKDEIEALKLNLSNDGKKCKIVWKKCVNGVREMCDVCRTTIFNHHWSCGKCGFVVCVDCFKAKLKGSHRTKYIQRNFNKKIWLLCSNQEEHQVENLSITQILAGDALKSISEQMHNICHLRNIPLGCSCNENLENIYTTYSTESTEKLLNIANELCNSDDIDDDGEETSEMQDIIKQGYLKYLKSKRNTKNEDSTIVLSANKICAVECSRAKEFFAPKLSLMSDGKHYNAPHMWLCEGNLLRLLDPKSDFNYTIFQDQWKRGQPILVSDVGNKLSSSLWHPESFTRDFGNHINDLIDCTTGRVISDQPMSKFWNGFENAEERLCDKLGSVMLLKLKDWPPSADFAETLPDRFQDLMNCLPLKEYTHRNGKYNLASRLPECFVRPDLGPKMYTAYGNAGTQHSKVGTTNLHLDISDAVNVMVYVAITKNCKEFDYDWHVREAFKVIEEAGCDDLTKRRCYMYGETPGALWHIYHASDADSIRDLLIKVAVEHGTPMEEFSDPIHDQSQYLDEYLRERLYKEYGVKGYTIVQYYGDAIFIPAGAPHQVRNLHNCIKVAEDFVSPENVHHSFRMTQEFRHLTDSHTNHEDKLQIKNIVFHAVKDSISVLMHSQNDL